MNPTKTPLTTLIKEMREASARAIEKELPLSALGWDVVVHEGKHIALCNPENIRRVLDACDEMREALKFYGVVNNWTTYYKAKEGACMMDVFKAVDNEQIGTHFWCGKTARAVLAKHFGEGK